MDSNVTQDYDYSALIEAKIADIAFLDRIRMQYIAAYLVICTLGMILNTYVIVACCRLYHNLQKSASSLWVLALAVTHLISSVFLVMQLLYAWHRFNWQYGVVLCKISSYVIYASMFSTASLLSLWTISTSSSCIQGLCAKCGINGISMDLVLVLSSWTIGTVLSIPSLLSRELRNTDIGEECRDKYELVREYGPKKLTIVALSRFVLGFLGPMFVMIIFPILARWQKVTTRTLKRITCAIKLAYFVCWTPLLFMALYQATLGNSAFLKKGLPAATVLAAAHSCINPVIYLLLGHKLNMHWMADNTPEVIGDCIALNQMEKGPGHV